MVILLGGVGFAVRAMLHDEPPSDDSVLLPRWSDRGGDANPLAVFEREMEAHHLGDAYDQLPESVRKREKGTEGAIRDFLQKRSAVFASFEKLAATDIGIWQWPEGPRVSEVNSEFTKNLGLYGDAMQSVRLKVHLLCTEGRQEEAGRLGMQIIRYGRGLQGAEGGLIQMLVAVTAERIGHDALKQALTEQPADLALLRSCLEELRSLKGLRPQDYQFAMRTDYLWFKHAVSKMEGSSLLAMSNHPLDKGSATAKFYTLLYKRNRTLAMRVNLDRPVVEALDSGWPKAYAAAKEAEKWGEDFRKKKDNPLFYMDSNITGKILIMLSLGTTGRLIQKAMAIATLHEQLELMLALRLFELEHGKLPERLEELVPAYVAAVPADPVSGKPLIWHADSGVLYSVGFDGKDDGGNFDDDKPTKSPDLGTHYWWSAKAAAQAPK